METEKGMKLNRKLVILALILLIGLLLICKLSNYWYASDDTSNTSKNNFATTGTIPLQYNDIYYYGDVNKIPCGNKQIDLSGQAQIPCIMRKKCPDIDKAEEYKLSDSDRALLYKEVYRLAGKEVLNRAIASDD